MRYNLNDYLPLTVIFVRAVFHEDNKYYPHTAF